MNPLPNLEKNVLTSFKALTALALSTTVMLTGCQMVKPEPSKPVNIGNQISSPEQYGVDAAKWETKDWKIAAPSDLSLIHI